MPIEFHCRHCGKALRAPDEGAGRRCRCPDCSTETTVPSGNLAAGSAETYPFAQDTKDCPYCGEQIKAAARKCRFCGTMLQGPAPPGAIPGVGPAPPAYPPSAYPGAPVRQGRSSGFAVAALVLGLLGLCGIGSILAIIFGAVALKQIDKSNGELTGKGMAKAGLILGIVWLVIMILYGAAIVDTASSY